MKVKLDKDAFMPERAHETDAGLDLKARYGQIVCAKESAVFRTGVHIELPPNTCGLLVSKSGLYTKHGIISTGLIDQGYTGEIVVTLSNLGGYDYAIGRGDKISQLVILPCTYEALEQVETLEETERGENGFGSTGK